VPPKQGVEHSMSTVSLVLATIYPTVVLRLSQLKQIVSEWCRRIHSRFELANLDDVSLRDIGVSRCTAQHEAAKPFWLK
jgi:uncharacterized protein YjiS (DUF1127 family)